MKAVFNAIQLGHRPSRYLQSGNIVDYPETPDRARKLLEGARKAGAQIYAGRSYDIGHIEAVHDRRYIKFLQKAWRSWRRVKGAGPEIMPSIRPVEKPARYPGSIIGRAGWHQMDFSCPILEDTWKVAEASANTAITAAHLIETGESAVYALCRPPGHHAFPDKASGFCYLNNTAIVAQYLRKIHERVAVLDIDVHHGNGTQAIFYARNDVLTLSIHADPRKYYPFFYGYESQRGRGPGTGYNLNIPLPVGSDDDVWMGALEYALEIIAEYDPGALVIALGLDAHEADPLKGGAMTTGGFERLASRIVQLSKPMVVVQEGGYLTDSLSDNLASFLGPVVAS